MQLDELKLEETPLQGVYEMRLGSWREFAEIVNSDTFERHTHIFRGQRDEWSLIPKIIRPRQVAEPKFSASSPGASDYMRMTFVPDPELIGQRVLERFRQGCRGRLKLPESSGDNEWWAYGQHVGLSTPLLDWTMSPYTALFFAFAEQQEQDNTKTESGDSRSVYVLDRKAVERKAEEVRSESEGTPVPEFVDPYQHDNARLISQSGIFVKSLLQAPKKNEYLTLEGWVSRHFADVPQMQVLLRFQIDSSATERADCLRALNLMNINYRTLFPDLDGVAMDCNLALTMRNY